MILKKTNALTVAIDRTKLRKRVLDSIAEHYPEIGYFGLFEARQIQKILNLDKNKLYWLSILKRICIPITREYGNAGRNKFDRYDLFKLALAQELQELGFDAYHFDTLISDAFTRERE